MTNNAKNIIKKQNVNATFPYLIKFYYKDEVYRYVNSSHNVMYQGEEFEAVHFELDLPKKDTSSISDARISIDFDYNWIEKIRNYKESDGLISVKFIGVINYYKDGTEYIEPIEEMDFTLKSAVVNNDTKTIEWSMIFDDLLQLIIPCDVVTAQNTPGIV